MAVTLFLCALLVCLFLFGLYIWNRRNFSYWTKLGVPDGPPPTFILGNLTGVMMAKDNFGRMYSDIYKAYKHFPYVGIYHFYKPTLLINDLDMIKNVLVKDFVHFSDHNYPINEDIDPLAAHLFHLTGERWKQLRAKITPTFTTNKMKYMFNTVLSCCNVMMSNLEQIEEEDMNVQELLTKLGLDVIGTSAFGIECNSFKEPNSKFRQMARRIKDTTFRQGMVMIFSIVFPTLHRLLKLTVLETRVNNFFIDLVNDTVGYREKNNIQRNDFLQLMIRLKNEGFIDDDVKEAKGLSDDGTRLTMLQVAAQVFVFFFAGFETSSTTVSFALYELALNPDIQDTLVKEIDEVLEKHDGHFTYDSLAEMTYLTNVIEETLRKHPPLPVLFRVCTKEYTMPGTDIKIPKDTQVMLPVYGIHWDPEYYPNPEKFDPERFTPENKASRHHFTHLPFGEGPRVCIGNRFGLMQTKLGMAMLLHKYEVSVCDKTIIPMKYDKNAFVLACEGGVWLKIKKRVK